MNNLPGALKVASLLEELRAALKEFASREEKLERDHQTRTVKERRQREATLAELADRNASVLVAVENKYRERHEDEGARHEARKKRIDRARQASKEQTLGKIEDKAGRKKYEMQKTYLQSGKDREAALLKNESDFAEFKNAFASAQDELAELEKKARGAFRGYPSFRGLLSAKGGKGAGEASGDGAAIFAEVRKQLERGREALGRFRAMLLPKLFSLLPGWVALLLGGGAGGYLFYLSQSNAVYRTPALAAVGTGLGLFLLSFVGKAQGNSTALEIASGLGKARRLLDPSWEKTEARHRSEIGRIEAEYKSKTEWIEQESRSAAKVAVDAKGVFRERVDEKTLRIIAKNDAQHEARLSKLDQGHESEMARLKRDGEKAENVLKAETAEREVKLKAESEAQWQTLQTDWKATMQPIYETLQSAAALANELFPPWSGGVLENWKPPGQFQQAAKLAQLDVDVAKLAEGLPKKLELPGPARLNLPLCLSYPNEGSVLLETGSTGREEMVAVLNNIILRLLSATAPGRLNFTILDPVGLGQNFAGIMHLADYDEQLIHNRIWTQTGQIEEKLAELNEHMEKVIQMYLRNEYATIAEYNEQAGEIAEKYHFLVVADFPANFSEVAAKRLMSIASSGARCGVYTLIHWDRRLALPQDIGADELRKSSVGITVQGKDYTFTGKFLPGTTLTPEMPPAAEAATEFIHKVGRSSRDSSRVEVPFSHVAPSDAEVWSEDTTNELRVAIGRTGATKLQYLAIGKGTRQHALVAGKTGSGKSTLFHVIITNLALWCSPEQVEFYLVDFKKGVEFKCYASKRLPHARVVAIESDREFGLSVLQRVDDELKRRGDLFRKLGAQDIAGYKRAGGTEAIPRSLLLIDEFQEFFTEDDKVAQGASVLLDRIVRQGRAFGIHVVLGSQTLGGAYTLARTTLGQMVIRIALQCNEADAYLIMDENNPAPRLLSRPGEGIYNDAAGSLEGNSPFQVVWLPDEVRDASLDKARTRAGKFTGKYPGPIVFEGNAPADVRENLLLRALLTSRAEKPPTTARLWLGAPNSIKGPTEAPFQRQSGNNLLVVGQRDDAVLAMITIGLVSLAAQYPAGTAKFVLVDGTPQGSPEKEFLERVVATIPHGVTVAKGDVSGIVNELHADLKRRKEDATATAPVTFLFLNGLQRFAKLRFEEDFTFSSGEGDAPANPGAQLNDIITEGPANGMHVIAALDTYNNVSRCLSRKSLSEFEMRVLFQMGANDSASLIDNPRANTLGLHRALFFNQQQGHLEVFRPYAMPEGSWFEEVQGSKA